MDSEYGFIGEIKYDEEGTKYLQTHAITNIAWNAATRAFYEDNAEKGLKFTNLDSLFGKVLTTKKPVLSNRPREDPRRCGVPEGHPPLNHFLGIPFFEQGAGHYMNGMVGIANKPGGYSQADIAFLEPFVTTCSNLIQAYGAVQQNNDLINNLEEMVTARTQALKLANFNLEEANVKVLETSAAQLRHFACMSHEIRTPMNCITGLTSLLLETDLTPGQEESLRLIDTSGDLLLRVVNDVLDFSKLQSGNVEVDIQRSNLQETLNAVVHSIDSKAHESHIKVQTVYDVNVPEFVKTDSRRLQQILYNLLGNAVKFSDEASIIELHVELVECSSAGHETSEASTCPFPLERIEASLDAETSDSPEGSRCPFGLDKESSTERTHPVSVESLSRTFNGDGHRQHSLRFVVKDYGKGIEAGHFAKIFEPFQQAQHDTDRQYGGTGLGLAITSSLVQGLGGAISVDSQVGEWSAFTVEFPIEGLPADSSAMSKELEKIEIILINKNDWEWGITDVFGRYKAAFVTAENCDILDTMTATKGSIDESICYACLIHEDLYRSESYRRLASVVKTVLITFGPKYKVAETNRHCRSLVQMLPSVLMQSILHHSSIPSRVSKPIESAPVLPIAGSTTFKTIQILIAEDNVINQQVLSRILQKLGLEHIDMVDNGRKAVDQSAQKHYDLIFMDMQMPVMDGMEACRLITERDDGNPKPPMVVFVTANVSASFELEAKNAGGNGFIPKPFNLGILDKFFKSLG